MRINLKPLARFMEHLPKTGDVELSLLECHLLIEEVLTTLIEKRLKHPGHLCKARLPFEKKMWIARSLNDIEEPIWVWGAVKRLNEARNALAHKLEADEIQNKVRAFIASVEAEKGAPGPEELSEAIGPLQWAAFHVFSLLAAHAHVEFAHLRIPTLLTADERSDR